MHSTLTVSQKQTEKKMSFAYISRNKSEADGEKKSCRLRTLVEIRRALVIQSVYFNFNYLKF